MSKTLSVLHTETLAELKEEVSNVGEIARTTADHQLEERYKKVNSKYSLLIIILLFFIFQLTEKSSPPASKRTKTKIKA